MQVESLTPRGVCAVSLTAETDKSTYHLVAKGHFQIVYATPEILIKRTTRFRNIVMNRRGNKFTESLLSIVIDEAHIPLLWGHFRKEYEELPILRDYFPSASVVAVSATFSQRMKRHIIDTMSMTDPLCIRQSIRRRNILKMVSMIEQSGYGDLNILIPEDISDPNQIPRTLIYHDSVNGGIAIAQYLRKRLPPNLHEADQDKEIIRLYAGYLRDNVRSLYENDIQWGPTRIMVCTDACGMGINLKGILRVVQWKVKSNLGIEGIDQRFGRAGRSSTQQAIAIAFVDPSLLTPLRHVSGTSELTTAEDDGQNEDDDEDEHDDDDDDDDDGTCKQQPKLANVPDLLFRLTTPVTSSNKGEVQSLVEEIAAFGGGSHLSKRYFHQTWYKQDPGGLWFINVAGGCRHRVLMALFEDPDTFNDDSEACFDDNLMCCDICVKAALDANRLAQCPVIHGIPLLIGLAFQTAPQRTTASPNSSDDFTKVFSDSRQDPIRKSRIDKVKDAIRAWRVEVATPIVPPHWLLSDKAITKIGNAVKTKELTEILISESLEQSGISSKRSAISKHIPALMEVITKSLLESIHDQPPPRIPELPERPQPPPALPFMKTDAQIAYDMLQEQITAIQEADRAKQVRKRKKEGGHSRRPQPHGRTPGTSQRGDIGLVLRLGSSQSLIF